MTQALLFPVAVFLLVGGGLAAQSTVTLTRADCDPADATACIAAALADPAVERLVLGDVGEPWVSEGIRIERDRMTFELENAAVVLQPAVGSLDEFESLLNVRDATDVTVEGNGGTFLLDKDEYDRSSQFRHGINASGSTRLTIRNLTIRRAPGDGILVGPLFVTDADDVDGDGDTTDLEPTQPSRDIVIDNVTCDANNRQGISVTSVVGLEVIDSRFVNTQGTEPESGVDFEPFRRYQPMQGIRFANCTFAGNHGNGIQFGGVDIDATSPPSDILIEDCLVEGNGRNDTLFRAGIGINNVYNPFAGADRSGVEADRTSAPGTLTVRRTVVRDEPASGLDLRQYATGLAVRLDSVTMDNVANAPRNPNTAPILVQPPRYGDQFADDPCFGNVAFVDVRIVDDQTDRRQVTIDDLRAGPSGPGDVTGEICVEFVGDAEGASIDALLDDGPCSGFALAVVACDEATLPIELTAFGVDLDEASCEHVVSWSVASAGDVVGFAIEHSPDGVSWAEAWAESADDTTALGDRRATLDGAEQAYYRLRTDFHDGTHDLSAVAAGPACGGAAGLPVASIAAGGRLRVRPSTQSRTLRLVDLRGAVVAERLVGAGQRELDVSGLAPGTYAVSLTGAEGAAWVWVR